METNLNPKCQCVNLKCPNKGNCPACIKNHHKFLHTYCRAGKLERFIRKVYAKLPFWKQNTCFQFEILTSIGVEISFTSLVDTAIFYTLWLSMIVRHYPLRKRLHRWELTLALFVFTYIFSTGVIYASYSTSWLHQICITSRIFSRFGCISHYWTSCLHEIIKSIKLAFI